MRHFFLTSALVCWTLLFAGAMERGPLFSSPPGNEAFLPRSPETPAGPVLERMLAALAPERVLWLSMAIRQKMFGEDAFEARGRYLLGPDERLRLEMRITRGGREGRVLFVSDGLRLFQGRRFDGEPEASSEPLPSADAGSALKRRQFLAKQGLGGLLPLLQQIRQSLQEPVAQTGTWQGRPALMVQGAWNASEDTLKNLPPGLRARRCRIILDPETLWVQRIEWLGSPRPLNYPVLLLEMDFLDAAINRPLTSEDCNREFHWGPGFLERASRSGSAG